MTPARGLAWTALGGLLLWLALSLAIGCAVSASRTLELEAGLAPRAPAVCDDGAAPALLADPACVAGGCGWSCLPGRQAAPGTPGRPADGGWPW